MLKKIEDIKKSLKAESYLSALALTLTLPDICGKVAYPKLKTGERYIKWFDEHITKHNYPRGRINLKCSKLRCTFLNKNGVIKKITIKIEENKNKKNRDKYNRWFDKKLAIELFNKTMKFDGKKCYKLRCSFLHEGSTKGVPDIDHFELCIQKPIDGLYVCSGYERMTELTHAGKKITTQSVRLEINQICFIICANAEAFYNSHDDKSVFNDQNITIRDIDAEANKIREINNLPSIEEEVKNTMRNIFPETE